MKSAGIHRLSPICLTVSIVSSDPLCSPLPSSISFQSLRRARRTLLLAIAIVCPQLSGHASDDVIDRYNREIFVPSAKHALQTSVNIDTKETAPSFADLENLYRTASASERPTLAIFLMVKADYQGEYAFRFVRLIQPDLGEIRKRAEKVDEHSLEELCRLLHVETGDALRRIRYFTSGQLNTGNKMNNA
jgi:hypothetical protein